MSVELLLDAVLSITDKQDLTALAQALRDALKSWLQADSIRVLLVSNGDKGQPCADSDATSNVLTDLCEKKIVPASLVGADADLVLCLRSRQLVSRALYAKRRRLIVPGTGPSQVDSVLVLDGLRDCRLSDEALLKLMRIFGNHVSLLARSQLDPLTGLYNRQSFQERLRQVMLKGSQEAGRRRADESSINCFALVDVDHFKGVNDRYGHLYGDEVLLLMSRLMTSSFRHEDLLFRYGGEEFAVLLGSVGIDMAITVLERFRETVATFAFPQIGRMTVSVGVVGMLGGETVDTLVARADKALYYAKNHGRNRVCSYERLLAAGEIEPAEVRIGEVELF